VEETHYYPFGLAMAGISSKAALGLENKYKYSGKELQSREFSDGSGLDQYDFGIRMYNQQIGRFQNIDPEAKLYFDWSPYDYVRNNPILRVDPTGKWDVTVHVYNDRQKYGYGYAVVTDRNGREVYTFKVRVEGTGGRDRMVKNSDTPLGTYDIPNKGKWVNTGSRLSYGPNYRLVLNGKSGEIKESGRSDIRIHGGRQEKYDEATGGWSKITNATLKKTHGCMRAFDADIKKMKEVTDNLEKNDNDEYGGQLTVVDDLIEKDGKYVLPNSSEKENPQKNSSNDSLPEEIQKFFERMLQQLKSDIKKYERNYNDYQKSQK